MNFKIVKSKLLFKGKVFDLQVDEIEYNSGNKAIREVALHPGGAVVVPVTADNKIIMVTQYRYPLKKVLLELPAGKLDFGEKPINCAVRELEEETGYKANAIEGIGKVFTTPGYSSEELHIFIAKDLTPGDHKREEGEYGMEVFEYSFEEIEKKIADGEIVDGKTISGIFLVRNYLD
jgi:ADP-ribose pyrophosphatase